MSGNGGEHWVVFDWWCHRSHSSAQCHIFVFVFVFVFVFEFVFAFALVFVFLEIFQVSRKRGGV